MNQSDEKEWLKGSVERVTFHSEESGFCVLRVKVRGRRELTTVIGSAATVQSGEFIECCGIWVNDRQHGLQFKSHHLKVVPPTTIEGMEKYLASGMIKGIGPGYAKRLIKAFKDSVFDVIEQTPERLFEVEGIGNKRKQKIIAAWEEQKAVRNIMVFLQSHGVGTARAARIYKTYGDTAIEVVKKNPYRLSQDIHGIGFKTADTLAMKLGIAKDSLYRVKAGITYQLQEFAQDGHCGHEKNNLVSVTAQFLEVSDNLVLNALKDEVAEENLIEIQEEENSFYYLKSLYLAEKGIAQHVHRLMLGKTSWSEIDITKALTWVQSKENINLSASQVAAVTQAIQNKIAIITGGPGVGKTTIVNCILSIIKAKKGRIIAVAPTGRAAKRLSEAIGFEAKTIHRLLEFDPSSFQFKRNQEHPLETDYLVIDECSMVDVVLMNQLLKAIPSSAGVLFVGDIDQLPSVGPGSVLQDLIASNIIATSRLTDIFRQAATSKIITNAHLINQGKMPLSESNDTLSDFYMIYLKEAEDIQRSLLELVTNRIPKKFNVDPINDIQVLTPTRRGGLGTVSLNLELQKKLNQQSVTITKYGNTYGKGDKVIQLVNNYDKDIFNGDIGVIREIDSEEGMLQIDFDGKLIEYDFSELDEINLAYATTIHKSQGSEYPVVVIPLATQHYTLLERNLLYTGVTRGKKLVVLVGQKKAVGICVSRRQAQKRVTYLKTLLSGADSNNHEKIKDTA